jgi:putative transposase
MVAFLVALLAALRSTVCSRTTLIVEVFALRHQLAVLRRQAPTRLHLRRLDRLVWVGLSQIWTSWRRAIQIVSPDTVVRWHRRGFALYWRWKSRPRGVGRPALSADLRALIRAMQGANPPWGAPRIHGELRKLGIEVAQSTVAKYLRRRSRPPSQTWRTFLANHVSQIASIDFFTVPTATFRVLFVLLVLSHERRRVLHFNVTEHPTAAWTAQQLREAWPGNDTARFLLHDRDRIYSETFRATVNGLGMAELTTAPRSPWQNPFVERLIGSIRRECLDHLIIWNERALRRHLHEYVAYYHQWRTHLSLEKDAPLGRAAETLTGRPIVGVPHVGGLHHHYERLAA